MESHPRLIGRFKGQQKGPLVFVIGAMHGNEPAGVIALKELFERIEKETKENQEFSVAGDLIGLVGNFQAYQSNCRYITQDLNRSWLAENIHNIMTTPIQKLQDEDLEMREIIQFIEDIVQETSAQDMYLLDLHTTSSHEAVFSIASDDPKSLELALSMCAPVITGLVNDLTGTSLHYFNKKYQKIPTVALGFECGHHTDPQSPLIAVASILNFLKSLGVMTRPRFHDEYNKILLQSTQHLPKKVSITYRHPVEDITYWQMIPGYKNFQPIKKGELLAFYKDKGIQAPHDGRLLMPLYQTQGQDGFFIIQEID